MGPPARIKGRLRPLSHLAQGDGSHAQLGSEVELDGWRVGETVASADCPFSPPEAGTEGQETAEITDFQRVRFCKVVAAAPPPGAAR